MVCRRSAFAVAVCILVVISCTADAQRDFSCLMRNGDLECVRCIQNITVDPSSGADCGALFSSRTSLDGMVCSRLADALESIAAGYTAHPPFLPTVPEEPCITVYVYPSPAQHVIGSSDMSALRTVTANVVLRGVELSTTASPTELVQQPQVCVGRKTLNNKSTLLLLMRMLLRHNVIVWHVWINGHTHTQWKLMNAGPI